MERTPQEKYRCCFPGCPNRYLYLGQKNKRYFKFPVEQVLNQRWREICQISISAKSRHVVCEDHFAPDDFRSTNKMRLRRGVVPSVQCNLGSAPSVQCNEECLNVGLVENQPGGVEHKIISKGADLQDHNYCCSGSRIEVPGRCDKYAFLDEGKKGVLGKIRLSRAELTPRKELLYKVHRSTMSKISKLKRVIKSERNELDTLKALFKSNRFEFIDEELNSVSREFLNSQLRNCHRKPLARRWTEQDKVFALSIYKKSPRLYRYLQLFFQLPSVRTLKYILSKIPFETGVNAAILEHLAKQVRKMKKADRVCALLFDEISLSPGLHYDPSRQLIFGVEDLGSLGRANKDANHALVFMVRGLRKQWKQVVAYYFTAHTISSVNLKTIVKEIITQLQSTGLNVVATVCDQGSTNQSALTQLCAEPHPQRNSYYFFVNSKPIVTIYDVPHLLKNTRNALLKCKLQFEQNKFAKFEYIEQIFNIDQSKSCKALPKLRKEHFNFRDSFMKMKVKVAAAQLSASVASAIETFACFANMLPSEAVFTAEFVQLIDNLFDSLNGTSPFPSLVKKFRCALRENSPHWDLWSKLIIEMDAWKLIDLQTGVDCTRRYSFIRGWQTTMKSVMFLWNHLKDIPDFTYLCTRSLNQDPVENLFSSIRQHGIANTNPTCYQFVAALKTVVVNKLVSPSGGAGNCEEDLCTALEDLGSLLKWSDGVSEVDEGKEARDASLSQLDELMEVRFPTELEGEDCQGLGYLAGYFLNKIDVPDCDNCRKYLYSEEVLLSHLYTSFKECDNQMRLKYASERVMLLVQNIHDSLYTFLDANIQHSMLEDRFKAVYKSQGHFGQAACQEHDCESLILDKSVRLFCFKYVRDRQKRRKRGGVSDGHVRKMKIFKA